MISAYKIGVELALTGNLSRVITDITKQFETLNVAARAVQGTLTSMTGAMRNASTLGKQAAQSWTEAANAMERAGRAMGNGGGRTPGAGGGGNMMLGGAAAGAAIAFAGGGGRIPPGGGGQLLLGGPGGGGGMPPIVPSGASAPFMAPSGLTSHQYALAAVGYGLVGHGIANFGSDAMHKAGEISHLQALMRAQNVSPSDIDSATIQARSLARSTPGVTIEQALAAAIDLRSVLGGTHDNVTSMGPAMTATPAFVKTMAVLNAIGNSRRDPTFAAAKAQELLGHLTDERTHGVSAEALQRNLDMSTRVAIATGGRVGPTDYLAFAKQARVAGMNLNENALYGTIPEIMLQMGGNRAGTGLSSMFRQFSTGTMTKNRVGELQRLGLLDRRAVWEGGQVRTMGRDLRGYDQMRQDPVQWIFDKLIPALERSGVRDPKLQAAAVARIASTQVGAGFIGDVIVNRAAIQRGALANQAAQTGTEALQTIAGQDYTLAISNLGAAFTNMMTDLGGPLLQPAIDAMNALVVAMNAVGQWARENPETARRVGELAAAFAAFAIGTAAYSAIVFLGGPMIALAGAMGNFAAGTAAAMGLSGLVGGVGSLAAALASLPVLSTLLALRPSETNGGRNFADPTISNETAELRRLGLGFRPAPEPSASTPSGPQDVRIINPRDIASGVVGNITDRISRPMGSGINPLRITPPMPGGGTSMP